MVGRWFLVAFLMSGALLFGAAPSQGGNSQVMAADCAAVQKAHPGLDVGLLMRFYEEYSPDLLAEWRRRSVSSPRDSGGYLQRLASHFMALEAVRRTDMGEYNRLLDYELLQGRVRSVSHEIQRLIRMGQDILSEETEIMRQMSLSQAKDHLKLLLERSFDEAIRQQKREINRLEATLQKLREDLNKRERQRTEAIGQRFLKLTGESLPIE